MLGYCVLTLYSAILLNSFNNFHFEYMFIRIFPYTRSCHQWTGIIFHSFAIWITSFSKWLELHSNVE